MGRRMAIVSSTKEHDHALHSEHLFPKIAGRIAIHQPNYAPWVGYFAKMASADVFVFLDDCQMPIGRSYVSRVQVKGREGADWMSVPVHRLCGQPINAVRFAGGSWTRIHLATMRANYGRCPFFHSVMETVRPLYENPGEYLAPFNVRLICTLAGYLGLSPRCYLASELTTNSTGTQRLIDIVRGVGGTTYISGSGGVTYQDPAAFRAAGIELDIRVYHPVRYQQQGQFMPGLSILDALFHLGPAARRLLEYTELAQALTCSNVTSLRTMVETLKQDR